MHNINLLQSNKKLEYAMSKLTVKISICHAYLTNFIKLSGLLNVQLQFSVVKYIK